MSDISEFNEMELGGGDGAFMLDEDVSDVPEEALVPEGDYTLEIVNAVAGKSQSGAQRLSIEFKIVGGEHADKRIFENLSFGSEGARRVALKAMTALGCVQTVDGKRRIRVRREDLIGRQVRAILRDDEYQGVRRSRPARFLAGDAETAGGAVKPRLR